MHLSLIIFLISCLTSLARAPAPPSLLPVRCLHHGQIQPLQDPEDCTRLLETMSVIPWVQQETTFGHNQQGPGRLPLIFSHQSCQLTMDEVVFLTPRIARFRLVQYFPDVHAIVERCLRWPRRYPEGVVYVQETFYVRLGGMLPGNETGVEYD